MKTLIRNSKSFLNVLARFADTATNLDSKEWYVKLQIREMGGSWKGISQISEVALSISYV